MMNNTGFINNKTDKWVVIAEVINIKKNEVYMIRVFKIKPEIK